MKRLLMAKHLTNNQVFYWNLSNKEFDLGIHDYAIVECLNEIQLVKVIGVCLVKDDFKYGNKRVLKLVNSKELYNE